MSTTTQAPQHLDPAASLHAETLGRAPGRHRLTGRSERIHQHVLAEVTHVIAQHVPTGEMPGPVGLGQLVTVPPDDDGLEREGVGSLQDGER